MESPLEKIERLRRELDEHNYNYYVLNAPTIDDRTFGELRKRRRKFRKINHTRRLLELTKNWIFRAL